MCLLVFAWQCHPRYSLVFAGNRDEFHARPASAADWWDESFLAGRDLQGGGAWLGISRNGRFGVVTNYREPALNDSRGPSRGLLIPDYAMSHATTEEYLLRLRATREAYAGFNLILGDRHTLHYISNRTQSSSPLPPGIYGLSNHRLDTPWPKVVRARDGLSELLTREVIDTGTLLELLADRTPAADDELPDTGVGRELEQLLSAPFIVSERYGTRCSTAILVGTDEQVIFQERRFDASGASTGESVFELQLTRRPAG